MTPESTFDYIIRNLDHLTVGEIRDLLAPYMKHVHILTDNLPAGTLLYRARKYEKTFHKDSGIMLADLSYPAPGQAETGRLNRKDESLFYASFVCEPAIFELQTPAAGDRLVISQWEAAQDIPIHHMGYTTSVLKQSSLSDFLKVSQTPSADLSKDVVEFHRMVMPDRDKEDLIAACARHITDVAVHKAFIRTIPSGEEWQYRLSIALYDLFTEMVKAKNNACEGVIYPSAQTWPTGDNLALSPSCVDSKLVFRQAYEFQVTDVKEDRITARVTDTATNLGPDKSLFWTHAGRSFKAA